MAIDPSIPLGFQPTTPAPNAANIFAVVAQMKQMQDQQQARERENALRNLFQQPGSIDANGNPTGNTLAAAMRIDPQAGMSMQQSAARNQVLQTQAHERKVSAMQDGADAALARYDADLKAGIPDAQARQNAQSVYTDEREKLAKGGMFSEQEMNTVSPQFDPAKVRMFSDRARAWSQSDRQGRAEGREDERLGMERERLSLAERAGDQRGWELGTVKGPDGKDISVRVNKASGAIEPIDTSKFGGGTLAKGASSGAQFTPQMGELQAALAVQGVSIPTGMRSKDQMASTFRGLLEKYPGKSPDEIATMIKNGQIQFGAERKETQTAAGQVGRVEVAEAELEQFIPLALEASRAVPRGSFMPLTRLLQSADSSLGDPNLRALKVRVNAVLNAYDQLAARGGTDVEKRAEVRRLLSSADSPEAFEAALKSFQAEAVAARKAAESVVKRGGGETRAAGTPAKGEAPPAGKVWTSPKPEDSANFKPGDVVIMDGEKLIFNGWDKDKGVGKGKRWTRQDDAN